MRLRRDKMEDKKIELDWRSDKYEDAKKLRDSKARELRQEGYKVICKTWNFMDLGRFMLYSLEATKEG